MAKFYYCPEHPNASKHGHVTEEEWWDWKTEQNRVKAASHLPCPAVIRDQMEPTRHMADGQLYDSKRKFREVTKAHGCVEIGNETKSMLAPRKKIELDRRKRRLDIKRATWELQNGRKVTP